MKVRLLGAIDMVDASGPEMDRSESVTFLNDLSILAPGALLHPSIAWEPIDEARARARFTHGVDTVEATLIFGPDGLLADFASDDRSAASPDGKTFTRRRFTTPVRDYASYGPFRIARHGEARWNLAEGDFAYGEFELVEAHHDGGAAIR